MHPTKWFHSHSPAAVMLDHEDPEIAHDEFELAQTFGDMIPKFDGSFDEGMAIVSAYHGHRNRGLYFLPSEGSC